MLEGRAIRWLLAAGALAIASTTITHASAYGPHPVAQATVDWKTKQKARNAYAAGKKKLEAGDYVGALGEFRTAEALVPGGAPKYQIAVCLDNMGQTADAVAAYRTFIDSRPGAKYASEIVAAGKRLSELEAQLDSKVVVRVTPAGVAGTVITVDGSPAAGPELSLEPGTHTIEVTAPGYDKATQTVEVKGGESTDVSITLQVSATTPPAPVPAPDPDQPSGGDDGQSLKIAGFVVLGIGVVAGAVTAAFGVTALSAKNDFDTTPTNELADDAEQSALIADIMLGVTGAAGITGIVLLAVGFSADSSDESEDAGVPVVLPYAGPGGAGGVVSWSF
jgi:hypothetical protein